MTFTHYSTRRRIKMTKKMNFQSVQETHSQQAIQSPLIVIVSNRGPFSFTAKNDNEFDIERGTGGLVTALGALAQKFEVLWVASAMSGGDELWSQKNNGQIQKVEGTYLRLINPEHEKYALYYGSSNTNYGTSPENQALRAKCGWHGGRDTPQSTGFSPKPLLKALKIFNAL